MNNRPWDVHPALTEDKLMTLAETLKQDAMGPLIYMNLIMGMAHGVLAVEFMSAQ